MTPKEIFGKYDFERGDLFEDCERFKTKERAEERIKELLVTDNLAELMEDRIRLEKENIK